MTTKVAYERKRHEKKYTETQSRNATIEPCIHKVPSDLNRTYPTMQVSKTEFYNLAQTLFVSRTTSIRQMSKIIYARSVMP